MPCVELAFHVFDRWTTREAIKSQCKSTAKLNKDRRAMDAMARAYVHASKTSELLTTDHLLATYRANRPRSYSTVSCSTAVCWMKRQQSKRYQHHVVEPVVSQGTHDYMNPEDDAQLRYSTLTTEAIGRVDTLGDTLLDAVELVFEDPVHRAEIFKWTAPWYRNRLLSERDRSKDCVQQRREIDRQIGKDLNLLRRRAGLPECALNTRTQAFSRQ